LAQTKFQKFIFIGEYEILNYQYQNLLVYGCIIAITDFYLHVEPKKVHFSGFQGLKQRKIAKK
jgi:hypothetical protein